MKNNEGKILIKRKCVICENEFEGAERYNYSCGKCTPLYNDLKNHFKRINRKPAFPVVLKANWTENKKPSHVFIIYKKKVEKYTYESTETKADIDKAYEGENISYSYEDIFGKGWNAHHEVDLLKNNGAKRVHDSESDTWSD